MEEEVRNLMWNGNKDKDEKPFLLTKMDERKIEELKEENKSWLIYGKKYDVRGLSNLLEGNRRFCIDFVEINYEKDIEPLLKKYWQNEN